MKWLVGRTEKTYRGSTVRAQKPEDTWQAISPLFAQVGLSRVGLVTGLDCVGIPTAMAVRPNARSLSVSQGKGTSPLLARVSAAMESLELYHAEDIRLPLRRATLFDLQQEGGVIDVAALPRAFRAPYPELQTLWVQGHELLAGRSLWVPLGLVHMDLTLPLLEGSDVFPPSSSGLSSGNSVSEALVHALCELIERDAYTRFFQLPPAVQEARRLSLSTIQDPTCSWLVSRFAQGDLLLEVWDITSDIGLPSFLCATLEAGDNPFRRVGIAYGVGAHVNPVVALSRALTEAAQTRLTRISGSRDDMLPEFGQRLRSADQRKLQLRQFSPEPGARPFAAAPVADGETFEDDVRYLLRRLALVGVTQVVAVDLSRPGWPVAVVRALAPGLEAMLGTPAYHPGGRALGAFAAAERGET